MSDKRRIYRLEAVLAANLQRLMDYHQDNQVGAAKKARISQQQIGRILKGEHSVQLDTVSALAFGYDLQPFQLLLPGLDPANPPVLPLSAAERALYRRFEQVANEYAQQSRTEGPAASADPDSQSVRSGRGRARSKHRD